MRGRKPKTGQYTGNGSTGVSVDLGFKPSKVEITNITDGDVYAFAYEGMAAAKGIKIGAAVAQMSSAGITLGATGFVVGTDADLIENNKVFAWIAW